MNPNFVLSEESIAKLRNIMTIRGFDSLELTAEFVIAEGERRAWRIKEFYDRALPDEAWAANASYSEDELDTLNTVAKGSNGSDAN